MNKYLSPIRGKVWATFIYKDSNVEDVKSIEQCEHVNR